MSPDLLQRRIAHLPQRMGTVCQGLLILASLVLVSSVASAGGVVITVDSTSDATDFNDGTCTLREALVAAYTNSATDACSPGSALIPDRIEFDDGIFDAEGNATIHQTSGYGIPDGEVYIRGPNDKTLTIVGNGSTPLFDLVQSAGPRFELTNVTLSGGMNSDTHGGAIEMGGEIADVVIDGVRFVDNHSDLSGGAIGLTGSENLVMDISNSVFERNSASDNGGAIYLPFATEMTVTLSNNAFRENAAVLRGGAIWAPSFGGNDVDSSIVIENSLFESNSASSGGAVYVRPSGSVDLAARIDGNGFHANEAKESFGGAIWFDSTRPENAPSNLLLTRNAFRGNASRMDGSAVRIEDALFDIVNNLFARNRAGGSGAVSIRDGFTANYPNPSVTFNTFFENVAGTNTDEVAAWDLAIELPSYTGNNLTISANAYQSPVSVADDAPCLIDMPDSVVSGALQAILNTQNAESCVLHVNDGIFDDLGLQLISVANPELQAVAEPKPGSPLIDVVTSSLCVDHDGKLLRTSLLGPRRDIDDVPKNGDPRTAARCDVGSIEVDEGRLLTIDRSGTGSGAVTSSPELIDCGAVCEGAFQFGTVMKLTASASPGSVFSGWSGPCSGTDDCTFELNADTTATAAFEAQPSHTVTVEILGSGVGEVSSSPSGIQCPEVCSADFAAGSSVLLEAVPAQGSAFSAWSGECSGISINACQLTVDSDLSAAAVFHDTTGFIFRDRFEGP